MDLQELGEELDRRARSLDEFKIGLFWTQTASQQTYSLASVIKLG
jgi:hypothetical protein